MPLTTIQPELLKARRDGYAVPMFDIFELSLWHDVVRVAELKRGPVIAGMYDSFLSWEETPTAVAMLKHLAEQTSVPVSLMLDHGRSPEQCEKAIAMGFTDVMFDGSRLSLEENIAQTLRVVEAAHVRGVCVEGELGRVGSGREYDHEDARQFFTDPDEAARFVEETGVDFLAVAVGTAHGHYKGEPRLDLDLLGTIAGRVDVPLVLHGGTGLDEAQYRGAIEHGITKINIATDLYDRAQAAMTDAATGDKPSFFSITKAMHNTVRERMGYHFDLFGAAGKAPDASANEA
jgi:fructose-bisphosphate aldolase class II